LYFSKGGKLDKRVYIQKLQDKALGMEDEAQEFSGGESRSYGLAGHLAQGLQSRQVDIRQGIETL
jgi:hypothetical protein